MTLWWKETSRISCHFFKNLRHHLWYQSKRFLLGKKKQLYKIVNNLKCVPLPPPPRFPRNFHLTSQVKSRSISSQGETKKKVAESWENHLCFYRRCSVLGNFGQLAKSQICVDYSRNLNFWHLKSNLTSKGTADWIIKEKKGNCHHRFLSIHFQRSYMRKSCCGRL